MLRYYLCLYLLLYMIQTMAQSTLIARNSFESSGDNWLVKSFSTPPCTDDNDSWNYHTKLDSIEPSNGNQFWGIKDLNGNCGSSGFESIEFEAIDIRQYRQVTIRFDYFVLAVFAASAVGSYSSSVCVAEVIVNTTVTFAMSFCSQRLFSMYHNRFEHYCLLYVSNPSLLLIRLSTILEKRLVSIGNG